MPDERDPITVQDLARMVLRVRQAQADYFARKDKGLLVEAKRLERMLDKMCDEVLRPTMFG